MAHLQLKNVPPEIHEKLRWRAAAEGMTMSDYVIAMLRRELALPSMRDWLESLHSRERVIIDASTVRALHEARDEREQELLNMIHAQVKGPS